MSELKKESTKKKITLCEETVTFEEFKSMNSSEITLPLGIIVDKPEIDTLIKVVNEYQADLFLIGLLMYYDKLIKCEESNILYFRLNSRKLLEAFNSHEFVFEDFISGESKVKHINKIYPDMSDVKIDFVNKIGILKKNVESVLLDRLINLSINDYVDELQSGIRREKCKIIKR